MLVHIPLNEGSLTVLILHGPLGWVLGCSEALKAPGVRKRSLRCGKSQSCFRGPRAWDKAGAMRFSDSWTSRHCWGSQKSREQSLGLESWDQRLAQGQGKGNSGLSRGYFPQLSRGRLGGGYGWDAERPSTGESSYGSVDKCLFHGSPRAS